MKEFFKVLKRYIPPYKKSLVLSLIFTLTSAVLNVFSFAIIIPILQILFKIEDVEHHIHSSSYLPSMHPSICPFIHHPSLHHPSINLSNIHLSTHQYIYP